MNRLKPIIAFETPCQYLFAQCTKTSSLRDVWANLTLYFIEKVNCSRFKQKLLQKFPKIVLTL